jgi:hypothetical protein
VQLRQAVDRFFQKLGAGVSTAIPSFVNPFISEAHVCRQIHDGHTLFAILLDDGTRCAMG